MLSNSACLYFISYITRRTILPKRKDRRTWRTFRTVLSRTRPDSPVTVITRRRGQDKRAPDIHSRRAFLNDNSDRSASWHPLAARPGFSGYAMTFRYYRYLLRLRALPHVTTPAGIPAFLSLLLYLSPRHISSPAIHTAIFAAFERAGVGTCRVSRLNAFATH